MLIGFCTCTHLAWLRDAGVKGWHCTPTLLTVKFTQGELPGASELEMWIKEKRGTAHLLESADRGEACSCPLRQSLPVSTVRTTPVRGEQGEALFGLTERLTASYQLLLPKRVGLSV